MEVNVFLPNKTIDHQSEEVQSSGGNLIGALRQFFQLSFGIRAEVDVGYQETTERTYNKISYLALNIKEVLPNPNLMKKNVSTLYAPLVMVWNRNSFSTTFLSSMLSEYLNTMMQVCPV